MDGTAHENPTLASLPPAPTSCHLSPFFPARHHHPSPSRHRLLLPTLLSLSPPGRNSSKEMLHSLVMASIGNHPNVAYVKVKAFVAKMLWEFPSREPVRHVFNRAFKTSLRTVKEWLEKYSSPDFRGGHDETGKSAFESAFGSA